MLGSVQLRLRILGVCKESSSSMYNNNKLVKNILLLFIIGNILVLNKK